MGGGVCMVVVGSVTRLGYFEISWQQIYVQMFGNCLGF